MAAGPGAAVRTGARPSLPVRLPSPAKYGAAGAAPGPVLQDFREP